MTCIRNTLLPDDADRLDTMDEPEKCWNSITWERIDMDTIK